MTKTGGRPNLLLIMTDQMRLDALAQGGRNFGWTPNLDSLAGMGMMYTRCCTNSPICAPARASILSGLYPAQMGVWSNAPHTFPADACNWVKLLRAAGYRTSVFGKTHYYPYNGSVPDMREAEPLIRSYGYDDIDEIPGPRVSAQIMSHMGAQWEFLGLRKALAEDLSSRYKDNHAIARPSVLPLQWNPDVYVGRTAMEYFEQYDREEPFFSFVSFGGPHDPWDCPAEFSARFDNDEPPPPLPPFTDAVPGRPQGAWDEGPDHPPFSKSDIVAIRRNYAGKVSLIDHWIGRILEVLTRRGMLDNTVVMFTSDHGEMNGDHGRLYKYLFLAPSLMVPMIVAGKGITPGTTDRLVELIDIGPTLLAHAGIPLAYPQCGIPLHESDRTCVFSQYKHETMVWDGSWKMIVNKDGEAYLLFDTANDPFEQHNLVCTAGTREIERQLLSCLGAFNNRIAGFGFTKDQINASS